MVCPPHLLQYMIIGALQHGPIHLRRVRHGKEIGAQNLRIRKKLPHVVYIINRRRLLQRKSRCPGHPGDGIRHIQMGVSIEYLFREKIRKMLNGSMICLPQFK